MSQITANDLRWLAESADGKREEACLIVWDTDGKPLVVKKADYGDGRVPDMDPERPPLDLEVMTPYYSPPPQGNQKAQRGGMHKGVTVKLLVGTDVIALPDNTDAVFLTQTAVEKFVLPYYTRMEPPDWIQQKKDELFAPEIVAAAHADPSITTGYPRKEKTYPLRAGASSFDTGDNVI
ncbi:MAG: hypothetical protein ABR582_14475 [Gemmatimonadaceae bacterium]